MPWHVQPVLSISQRFVQWFWITGAFEAVRFFPFVLCRIYQRIVPSLSTDLDWVAIRGIRYCLSISSFRWVTPCTDLNEPQGILSKARFNQENEQVSRVAMIETRNQLQRPYPTMTCSS